MGLLDTQQSNGLLDFGMGLLSAGGPSRMPVGLGQAMGQGMQQMQAGNQQRQAMQMMDMQMQNQALHQLLGQQQLQTGQMSMDEARRKLADDITARKTAQDFWAKQRKDSISAPSVGAAATDYGAYLNGGAADGRMPLPDMDGYSAAHNAAGVPLPDRTGGVHDSQYRQMMGLAQLYEQAGLNDKAMALRDQATKIAPKFATEFRQAVGADGKLHNYQVADDGTYKEVPLGVKPDFVLQDLGEKVQAVDRNSLANGAMLKKTMTLAEEDASARGWNQINHPALSFHDSGDGAVAFNPRTGATTPILGENGKQMQGAGGKLTEVQGKAALFGARAEEADKILSNVEGKYSRTGLSAKTGAEGIWGIGGVLGNIGNLVSSNNMQKADQAQKDFVNAVLRQESGAAISRSEFVNARQQYFPQPGDSEAVVAQKARNRQTAIMGFKNIAGKGAYAAPEINSAISGGGWSATIIK